MGIIDGRGNLIDEQDDDSLPTWAQLNRENESLRARLATEQAENERLRNAQAFPIAGTVGEGGKITWREKI